MKEKRHLKVSFIKALKPCMRARGRKGFRGKNEGLIRVFSRDDPSKASFFCPAKCHTRLRREQEARTFLHTPFISRRQRNQTIVKSGQTPSKVSKVTATNFTRMNTDLSPDQASERRRSGECSFFLPSQGDSLAPHP